MNMVSRIACRLVLLRNRTHDPLDLWIPILIFDPRIQVEGHGLADLQIHSLNPWTSGSVEEGLSGTLAQQAKPVFL